MRATQWVADDGTIFNDENECRAYEEEILKAKMNMKSRFYNAFGDPLLPSKNTGIEIYQNVQYIYVAEDEAALVNDLLKETDFTESGIYVYGDSDFSNCFVKIDDLIQVVEKAKQIVGK